jgi:flagellar biosynthesis/type III secretory pathway protein FliH
MREIPITLTRRLRGIVVEAPGARPVVVAAPPPQERPAPPAVDPQAQKDRQLIEQTLASLSEAIDGLEAQQRQRLEEMQQVAVELAVAIASRLVHERIEAGDFAVETLVRQVVERLGTSQPATVGLHPDDLALLEKRLGSGRRLFAEDSGIRVVADPTLVRGSCKAETADSGVHAQIETQLADVWRHLLQTIPEAVVERRRPDQLLRRVPDRRQTA